MARCRCNAGTCSCTIEGGRGITALGMGTAQDPLILSRDNVPASDVDGLTTDALTDVDATNRQDGYVQAWDAANGKVVYAPPVTAAPGAVATGPGLDGDGSSGDPLVVGVDGSWGAEELSLFGSDDSVGQPLYVDSSGKVRATPEPVTYGDIKALAQKSQARVGLPPRA